LQERDFGGGPVHQVVAGEAEERGGGVAGLEREVDGDAEGGDRVRGHIGMDHPVGERGRVDEETDGKIERVRLEPFQARFGSGERRLRGEAGAFQDVEAVARGEKRPQVCGFRDVHEEVLGHKDTENNLGTEKFRLIQSVSRYVSFELFEKAYVGFCWKRCF
jgi:hypothetical protein